MAAQPSGKTIPAPPNPAVSAIQAAGRARKARLSVPNAALTRLFLRR
jgi:hypothetical protein